MFVRRRHAVAAVLAVALLTTGCGSPASSPTAEPTATAPSPTDSDTAAFAAAEATYRAYVDALNAVDLSDPTTFEPVYALTTGEMRDETTATFSEMRDQGWRVEGESTVRSLSLSGATPETVELSVCLDVHEVLVRDSAGSPVTSNERSPVQTLTITVALDSGRGLVHRIAPRDNGPAC